MKLYRWDSKSLKIVKVSSVKIFISILLVLFWCFVSFYVGNTYGFKYGKESKIMEEDVIVIYQELQNETFSKRNFYEYLKKINIKFPELVFAQAYKESGFKSYLWRHNRNPFGMKDASRRPNVQNGTQEGFGYYNTWQESILDYALYQSYIGLSKLKTEEEYLKYLKEKNYYDVNHPDNEKYLKDIKNIRDNIEKYLD